MNGQTEVDAAAQRVKDAQQDLTTALVDACPAGIAHNLWQHRDGNPPWCKHCRRTATGMEITR